MIRDHREKPALQARKGNQAYVIARPAQVYPARKAQKATKAILGHRDRKVPVAHREALKVVVQARREILDHKAPLVPPAQLVPQALPDLQASELVAMAAATRSPTS